MTTGVTWTNIGGYNVPVYDQSLFGDWQKEQYGTVDFGDGSNYGVVGYDPVWGVDYNRALSLHDDPAYNNWSNWSLAPTGAGVGDAGGFGFALDRNGFDGLLKIADKEGLRVRYSLQDGKYVPQLVGTEGWNSNRDNTGELITALMVAGGAGAAMMGPGAAASGAGTTAGSAAPMTTYGVLDTSLALPGTTFGQAIGGVGGMTAADYAAAYGPSVGEPISTSGFTGAQGGIGSLGSGWGMPGGVVAGEGGAATFGGASGGGLLSQAGQWAANPRNWPTIARAIGLLGGAIGGAARGGRGGDPYAGIQPQPTPNMNWAPPTFQAQGNTDTEKYMMNQYMPSLFPPQQNWQQNGLLSGQQQGLVGIPPLYRSGLMG